MELRDRIVLILGGRTPRSSAMGGCGAIFRRFETWIKRGQEMVTQAERPSSHQGPESGRKRIKR